MLKSQLAKYEDFNSLVLVERQRELASHQNKMGQIRYNMNVKEEKSRIDRQISAMRYHKKLNVDFNRQTRNLQMSQENKKLVRRIDEITAKKGTSERQSGGSVLKRRKKSNTVSVRSLNYNSRQKENERIYLENQKLFVKLKDSKAFTRKINQDLDYAETRKHIKIITKEPQLRLLALSHLGHRTPQFSPQASLLTERSKPLLPPINQRDHTPRMNSSRQQISKHNHKSELKPSKSQVLMQKGGTAQPKRFRLKNKQLTIPMNPVKNGERLSTPKRHKLLESLAAKGITRSQKILPEKKLPIGYGTFGKYQNATIKDAGTEDRKQKKKKPSTKRKSIKRKFDTVNVNVNSHSSLDEADERRAEKTQTHFRPSNASSPLKASGKTSKSKAGSSQRKMTESSKKGQDPATLVTAKSLEVQHEASELQQQNTLSLSALKGEGDETIFVENDPANNDLSESRDVNSANQQA